MRPLYVFFSALPLYDKVCFPASNYNKKNYNMILSCYNYGRVTIIYDATVNY